MQTNAMEVVLACGNLTVLATALVNVTHFAVNDHQRPNDAIISLSSILLVIGVINLGMQAAVRYLHDEALERDNEAIAPQGPFCKGPWLRLLRTIWAFTATLALIFSIASESVGVQAHD